MMQIIPAAGGFVILRPFYAQNSRRRPILSAAFFCPKIGGETMTLNILFFTVTIQKHKITAQQCIQADQSMKIRKEHIDRALMHRRM
ncbi:hypothetical protein BIV59_05930 [Bacillus sp. MUM 13]|nr:hypothetical protein BIV59_05930 [Bacillus sp. MUM 13]